MSTTKKGPKKTPKKTPADQPEIPGAERNTSNPKIDGAAKRYVEVRNKRIELNREEKSAHDTLLHYMIEAGVTHYEWRGVQVDVDVHQKCKVKAGDEKGDDE